MREREKAKIVDYVLVAETIYIDAEKHSIFTCMPDVSFICQAMVMYESE